MFKLTVIAGPNRGTSYAMQEGENLIGRQAGNAVHLSSAKVSKRHCVLTVSGGEVMLTDEGSSNGTFVNGVLTRSRKLRSGDRISVGEFVLEFKVAQKKSRAASAPLSDNVYQFPVQQHAAPAYAGQLALQGPAHPSQAYAGIGEPAESGGMNPAHAVPKDPIGKLKWHFEHSVMPFFYGLILRHQWKNVTLTLFAAFIMANLVVSVLPILQQSRSAIVSEVRKRAKFMARQIADANSAALAAGAETKAEIGAAKDAEGVQVAILTDLDNRIIAPGSMLNQYFAVGAEAATASKVAKLFKKGRTQGMDGELDDTTVIAIEPVKVYNPRLGRNEVAAMAIVSVDTTISLPAAGEMGMIYSEVLILTGLMGAFLLLVLYKLTLKPFQVLNDDIDKVLKGDMHEVTREFKLEELNPLWDVINSSLQRISRDGGGDSFGGGGGGPTVDDFLAPLRAMGDVARFGVVVCDAGRRIVYMNEMFQEISGIRADSALGQEFSIVARDQGLVALVGDLFERAPTGGDGVAEESDFSGISYRLTGAALGSFGGTAKGYLLTAVRID